MSKPKKPKRTRSPRRSPDARALEWAQKRLERAEKLQQWHTEKLQSLHAEIPRLRGIIAALSPTPQRTKNAIEIAGDAHPPAPAATPRPRKVVAGMDVTRFVQPRPPVVPEPAAPDADDDALLTAADNLPKGTPLAE